MALLPTVAIVEFFSLSLLPAAWVNCFPCKVPVATHRAPLSACFSPTLPHVPAHVPAMRPKRLSPGAPYARAQEPAPADEPVPAVFGALLEPSTLSSTGEDASSPARGAGVVSDAALSCARKPVAPEADSTSTLETAVMGCAHGLSAGSGPMLGVIIALLSTMGIGLPVFSAFLTDQKELAVMHLIFLSALQSAVLNPLAFVLLGMGRAVARDQEKSERLEQQRRAPLLWWLGIPISIIGQGFKPLVLVVGGMVLIGHLTSLRLSVLPAILVALESVVLPILSIYLLGEEDVGLQRDKVIDFIFLYGLLPVATSTLAISQSYCVDAELLASIASSLVLGKIFAFSLLLLGAYIITFSDSGSLLGTLSSLFAGRHVLSISGCTDLLPPAAFGAVATARCLGAAGSTTAAHQGTWPLAVLFAILACVAPAAGASAPAVAMWHVERGMPSSCVVETAYPCITGGSDFSSGPQCCLVRVTQDLTASVEDLDNMNEDSMFIDVNNTRLGMLVEPRAFLLPAGSRLNVSWASARGVWTICGRPAIDDPVLEEPANTTMLGTPGFVPFTDAQGGPGDVEAELDLQNTTVARAELAYELQRLYEVETMWQPVAAKMPRPSAGELDELVASVSAPASVDTHDFLGEVAASLRLENESAAQGAATEEPLESMALAPAGQPLPPIDHRRRTSSSISVSAYCGTTLVSSSTTCPTSSDVFLRTSNLEIGLHGSKNSLGSAGSSPSGFYTGSLSGTSLDANYAMTSASDIKTFSYTGRDQRVCLPGVSSFTVELKGAGGGKNCGCRGRRRGGSGGYTKSTITVPSSLTSACFDVVVGGKGSDCYSGSRAYGGGGRAGKDGCNGGGGGGGRSALRYGGADVLTAGGGGGAGYLRGGNGGSGAGSNGQSGYYYSSCEGKGGTSSRGGAGGYCSPRRGRAGWKYNGGDADSRYGWGGGGGGGGYYGGGAGGGRHGDHGGGGGGSGFASPLGSFTYANTVLRTGSGSRERQHGEVVITFHTDRHTGDFFLPGAPWEGWGLAFNGLNYVNAKWTPYGATRNLANSGKVVPSSTATDITADGVVTWHGQVGSMQVEQTTQVYPDNENLGVQVAVTLTNTGSSSMPNVCYGRGGDPDQGKEKGGSYTTYNKILYQPGHADTGSKYIMLGSYRDTASPRALRYGPHRYGYTPETCAAACSAYKYFALQHGGWCCCDNDWSHATRYGRRSNCCTMGGAGCNCIFQQNYRFLQLGSYRDTGSRALRYGPHRYGYTPETCAAACSAYKYFALQHGGWCCCDNDLSHATKYGTASDCCTMGGAWCNCVFQATDGSNSANFAAVEAKSNLPGIGGVLLTADSRARAGHGRWEMADTCRMWNDANAGLRSQTVGTTVRGDIQTHITWKLGTLAPGASTSLKYYQFTSEGSKLDFSPPPPPTMPPPPSPPPPWPPMESLYVNRLALTWTAAKAWCEGRGGSLVSIHSAHQNLAVRAAAYAADFDRVWVGGNDRVGEGRWTWEDSTEHFSYWGRALNGQYVNWSPHEPNNCCGNQDCLQMWHIKVRSATHLASSRTRGMQRCAHACLPVTICLMPSLLARCVSRAENLLRRMGHTRCLVVQ